MSTEPMIVCPSCSTEIKLTESLAAPLIKDVRADYESKIANKEAEISKRENDIRAQQKAISNAQKAIDEQVAEKLKTEREAIIQEESKKAKLAADSEIQKKTKEVEEVQEILKQNNKKLEEAQKEQAELLRKQRALDDEKRELDLTIEKRVQASIEEVHKKAKLDVEESYKLKFIEKEEQMSSMQKTIEDLKRKAEQGSQQLQGEALELELEANLNAKFPFDTIEPVPKGEFGGDVFQKVISPTGQACGAILWESKRTKNWSDGWLAKLRGDQRIANAEIAVLVSNVLPKGIDTFGEMDGVWITQPIYAIPLVIVLRQTLIEVSNTKLSQEGQETKMELVYQYLTGPKFKHRVEAIVEKFTDMQSDLDKERKSTMRLWAKRDAQIQGVIESTVGMYGDLQGIAGRALQEIEGLELPMLEEK